MTESAYRQYLEVDQFLKCPIAAKALHTSLQMGLIDHISKIKTASTEDLLQHLQVHPDGLSVLLSILQNSGVLTCESNAWTFTESFRRVLCYLDLIRCKLEMAMQVSVDYLQKFDVFVKSPGEFQHQSKLFEIFNYGRLLEITPENCAHATRWMRYTTVLTKYESQGFIDHASFDSFENAIDLGGNSGEFARQLATVFNRSAFTVADLPVVCEVGKRHINTFPQCNNVRFQPWDLRNEPVPTGFDLITCKSLLHDWPLQIARELVSNIRKSIKRGGQLFIFERARWNPNDFPWSFGELPISLFHYSYRDAAVYRSWLQEDGWTDIDILMVPLDVPFMLIQAKY